MRLDHVPAIQKRHLTILLHPDFIPRVRRNDIECGDMQSKLACLCELSKTCSEGEEIVPRDRGGEVGEGFTDVVDAGMLDAEDVAVGSFVGGGGGRGGVSEEGCEGAARVGGEFFEEGFGLGVG